MTTTPESGLRRAGFILIAISLAGTQIDIRIAQWAFFMAVVLWVVVNRREQRWREVPAFMLPLLAYAGWTLVSAAASIDPVEGFIDSKQLLLFLMVPVVATFARGVKATWVIDAVIAVGSVAALWGIVQFNFLGYDKLENRVVGPLDHWMTFSGVLMLVAGAALARLLYVGREWVWPAIAVPALVVALFYTQTRNAMVGLVAAVGVLMAERNWRLLIVLPVLAALFFAIAPGAIISRVQSIADLNDPSNRDRVAMARSGARIVQDHPITGVGPNMIPVVYAQYRDETYAVQEVNPHLHNVPMQIAAERGLPALAAWIWFVVSVCHALIVMVRKSRNKSLAAAALGGMAAMLAAGLTEYNFGDSEFQMLLLVMITLPFAANRDGGLPS